ncbi:MAG: conjugal transfer protein TraJ [Methylotenera sp.]|nr:MAG: conjugal transfer protein TraJ [Methylotenera sp.]
MFNAAKKASKDRHQQAMDWEASQTLSLQRSESRAWKITGVATGFAILSLAGLVMMLPFYKVVPMTFLVDQATGAAQLIDASNATPMTTAQMDKHWLEEYVNSRERYNWMLLQYDHDKTLALSDSDVAKAYRALYEGANAMDKQLGNYTERRIKIISTTLPPGNHGTAVVRFERNTRERGQDVEIGAQYVATMSYTYQKPSVLTLEKDVVANPMGFKVTGYVVDKENKGTSPLAGSSATMAAHNPQVNESVASPAITTHSEVNAQ